jgi:hypothetical protein
MLPKDTLYFDTETLGLNPYKKENKIVTTQFGEIVKNKLTIEVFKEWEIGEESLITKTLQKLCSVKKYVPVFTYNGAFDLLNIIGRMRYNDYEEEDYFNAFNILNGWIKHCDMIQFDNGYFVSMDKICNEYDIKSNCLYRGSDIPKLYELKEYDKIIAHGIDDIDRLYRLVNETNLSDRFYSLSVLKNRWKK